MNVGHEEEELKPYIEPQPDYKDPRRTGRHRDTQKKGKCIPLNMFIFFTHTQRPCVFFGEQWSNYDLLFLCACRDHAANGILSGGDPGLAGEPEV